MPPLTVVARVEALSGDEVLADRAQRIEAELVE